MKPLHTTAKASHYNKEAEHYDSFNEENSKVINNVVERILNKHHVKTVIDLTCGTGSQVFWLTKRGYHVVGADINSKMLSIAKNKAKQENLNIKFLKADMRTVQGGQFDVAITIFNAIGHLTKQDFEASIKNIQSNLKPSGIYIFDIFNLDYLLYGDNIVKLTIDWQTVDNDTKTRKIQYSTIDQEGILVSHTITHKQKNNEKPTISRSVQTLQLYTTEQLKDMLERNGFKVIEQLAVNGAQFDRYKSEGVLTIAQKITP